MADGLPSSTTDDARSRVGVSLAAAVVLGVGLVVAVLIVTLRSGSDADERTSAPDAEVTSGDLRSLMLSGELPRMVEGLELPEGDYTALCAEYLEQLSAMGIQERVGEATDDVQRSDILLEFYQGIDFEALIASAPPSFAPTVASLRDDRDAVLEIAGEVDDIGQLGPADLPPDFVESIATIVKLGAEECGLLASS